MGRGVAMKLVQRVLFERSDWPFFGAIVSAVVDVVASSQHSKELQPEYLEL
jgi:hypothetical protein